MVAIHQAFYQFAAEHCRGFHALDAGCGTGFGTAILARSAASALGVDCKDMLLRYGAAEYGKPRLRFAVMDVNRLGLPARSFDVVVADELLEHLPNHVPFLHEAVRVLKPGGLFICATVNPAHSFGNTDDPLNRNHYREFDTTAFRLELEGHFENVQLLGQGFGEGFEKYMRNRPARIIEWLLMRIRVKHRIPARWRAAVRSRLTGVKVSESTAEEFRVTDTGIDQALYLVALARRPAQPASGADTVRTGAEVAMGEPARDS